ncbi:GTPase Era [Myxococcota bacterium]|nr:GTPase Era [Myxococcota bacterium]MBU1430572.1 GTPase Era [Myxococcota bacterium]MBU1897558.1 GTPase Era [Myxococcota bacterium]
MDGHRCGFITLVGRPNVGKSTLLNRLLGEKIAITSPRPQTTRNRIPGVLTRPDAQLIFVDTPGLHHAKRALNRFMVEVAEAALWDTDVVVVMVESGVGGDGAVGISPLIRETLEKLQARQKRTFIVPNKIDRIPRDQLLPVMATYAEFDFAEILPVSAQSGDGVDRLLDVLASALPEGPALYPADALTDLPERFIAAEMIREKLFLSLEDELPYSTAVTISSWKDMSSRGAVEIEATVHVERESQKGIVIGKGGQMIKRVGTAARLDLSQLLDTQVHLTLFVRVDKRWTHNESSLRKMGYES